MFVNRHNEHWEHQSRFFLECREIWLGNLKVSCCFTLWITCLDDRALYRLPIRRILRVVQELPLYRDREYQGSCETGRLPYQDPRTRSLGVVSLVPGDVRALLVFCTLKNKFQGINEKSNKLFFQQFS